MFYREKALGALLVQDRGIFKIGEFRLFDVEAGGVEQVFLEEILHIVDKFLRKAFGRLGAEPDKIVLILARRIGDDLCDNVLVGGVGRLRENADANLLLNERDCVDIA